MLTRPLPLQPERADAARNREILLKTARRLLERSGVDGLTMDAVAREAGLGKGTIFRRFGSRNGLVQALINEIELDFQQHYISGPPPLGPGTNATDRLVAFGRERIRLIALQGDLSPRGGRGARHPLHLAGSLRLASPSTSTSQAIGFRRRY